jgi:general secretion pathway protein L
LKSALTLQIEAISAWPEQEVYWDYKAEKAEDNPKMLKITIVIIPKAVLDPWLQTFESVRLRLSGATLSGFDVNVIPPHMRRGSARFYVTASYLLAACILLVALAFLVREPYQQDVFAAQIQSEIARLEPDLKSLVKQEAEWKALSDRYQIMLRHLRSRDANLEALKILATLPQETFLLNYRYQNETVTVSGLSASALDVQGALEKSPFFQNVRFSSPITRDQSGKDRFTLTMSIEAGQ